MTFEEYAEAATGTANYKIRNDPYYMILGLCGETGEVAEKLKKRIRDDVWDEESVKRELGDVLWYLNGISMSFGFTLEDVAQTNLDKLAARKDRGTLQGSGDNR